MGYQWEEPFVVDDQRFRSRFGELATPLDVGAGATVAWAQKAFGEAESDRAALAASASARR